MEFVEWQMRPSAVRLFRQKGIDVHELQSDVAVKREDGGLEIDLLVVNETEVVLVELTLLGMNTRGFLVHRVHLN
ncbi:hypothetical protein VKI21_02675 [Cyanobacterium aponinum UTEX 3222]|uniref:Uncharacterized protein n=1 Tax=Cyanobacterium aponinum AL20115 TaxID=3090662 RepID=A0AAF0ZAD0_9CHRO|nr:hypothetical protein [Cyanobacterium aponinum]WPF88536.1 hypothetical protein SAY89_17355 [Cyanobacterium aponinum AL20115]WRL39769.1 hypothetical protein VKI22_06710 [Cyanobacterium aponinum UTEX 3221]WRL42611.1 hypothetical protein VKI21_02675 [Cyanobacterium aponinum UTEX 3222]